MVLRKDDSTKGKKSKTEGKAGTSNKYHPTFSSSETPIPPRQTQSKFPDIESLLNAGRYPRFPNDGAEECGFFDHLLVNQNVDADEFIVHGESGLKLPVHHIAFDYFLALTITGHSTFTPEEARPTFLRKLSSLKCNANVIRATWLLIYNGGIVPNIYGMTDEKWVRRTKSKYEAHCSVFVDKFGPCDFFIASGVELSRLPAIGGMFDMPGVSRGFAAEHVCGLNLDNLSWLFTTCVRFASSLGIFSCAPLQSYFKAKSDEFDHQYAHLFKKEKCLKCTFACYSVLIDFFLSCVDHLSDQNEKDNFLFVFALAITKIYTAATLYYNGANKYFHQSSNITRLRLLTHLFEPVSRKFPVLMATVAFNRASADSYSIIDVPYVPLNSREEIHDTFQKSYMIVKHMTKFAMSEYAQIHILGQVARPPFEKTFIGSVKLPQFPKPNFTITVLDNGGSSLSDSPSSSTSHDEKMRKIKFAVHDFIITAWPYFSNLLLSDEKIRRNRVIEMPEEFPIGVLKYILGILYRVDFKSNLPGIFSKEDCLFIEKKSQEYLLDDDYWSDVANSWDNIGVKSDEVASDFLSASNKDLFPLSSCSWSLSRQQMSVRTRKMIANASQYVFFTENTNTTYQNGEEIDVFRKGEHTTDEGGGMFGRIGSYSRTEIALEGTDTPAHGNTDSDSSSSDRYGKSSSSDDESDSSSLGYEKPARNSMFPDDSSGEDSPRYHVVQSVLDDSSEPLQFVPHSTSQTKRSDRPKNNRVVRFSF